MPKTSEDLNDAEHQKSSDLNDSEHPKKRSDLNVSEHPKSSDLNDSGHKKSPDPTDSKKHRKSSVPWFKRRFSKSKKTHDEDAMSGNVNHKAQTNTSSGNVNQNQQHDAEANTSSGNVNQNQQHDAEANSEDSLLRATKADIVVYVNRMCGRDGDGSKPSMCLDSRHPGLRDVHQTGGLEAATCSNSSLRSDDCSVHSHTVRDSKLGDLYLDVGNVKRCPAHVQRKLALEYQHKLLTSTIAHCAVR